MNEPLLMANESSAPDLEQEHNLKKIEDLKRNRKELTQNIETHLRKFNEEESDRIKKINIYLSSINFEEDQLNSLFPKHLLDHQRMITTIDLGEFRRPFLT